MTHVICGKIPSYGPQLGIIDAKGLPACGRQVGENKLMRTSAEVIGVVNDNSVVGRVSI